MGIRGLHSYLVRNGIYKKRDMIEHPGRYIADYIAFCYFLIEKLLPFNEDKPQVLMSESNYESYLQCCAKFISYLNRHGVKLEFVVDPPQLLDQQEYDARTPVQRSRFFGIQSKIVAFQRQIELARSGALALTSALSIGKPMKPVHLNEIIWWYVAQYLQCPTLMPEIDADCAIRFLCYCCRENGAFLHTFPFSNRFKSAIANLDEVNGILANDTDFACFDKCRLLSFIDCEKYNSTPFSNFDFNSRSRRELCFPSASVHDIIRRTPNVTTGNLGLMAFLAGCDYSNQHDADLESHFSPRYRNFTALCGILRHQEVQAHRRFEPVLRSRKFADSINNCNKHYSSNIDDLAQSIASKQSVQDDFADYFEQVDDFKTRSSIDLPDITQFIKKMSQCGRMNNQCLSMHLTGREDIMNSMSINHPEIPHLEKFKIPATLIRGLFVSPNTNYFKLVHYGDESCKFTSLTKTLPLKQGSSQMFTGHPSSFKNRLWMSTRCLRGQPYETRMRCLVCMPKILKKCQHIRTVQEKFDVISEDFMSNCTPKRDEPHYGVPKTGYLALYYSILESLNGSKLELCYDQKEVDTYSHNASFNELELKNIALTIILTLNGKDSSFFNTTETDKLALHVKDDIPGITLMKNDEVCNLRGIDNELQYKLDHWTDMTTASHENLELDLRCLTIIRIVQNVVFDLRDYAELSGCLECTSCDGQYNFFDPVTRNLMYRLLPFNYFDSKIYSWLMSASLYHDKQSLGNVVLSESGGAYMCSPLVAKRLSQLKEERKRMLSDPRILAAMNYLTNSAEKELTKSN